MASQRLKKPWVCKEGCSVGKHPCKHLEALIPSMRSGRNQLVAYEDLRTLERLNLEAPTEQTYPEFPLRRKLKLAGLSVPEIELMLDKVISNLSFADIARRQGFASPQIAHYSYKNIVKRLKVAGVTL